jgi:hypothetical protein
VFLPQIVSSARYENTRHLAASAGERVVSDMAPKREGLGSLCGDGCALTRASGQQPTAPSVETDGCRHMQTPRPFLICRSEERADMAIWCKKRGQQGYGIVGQQEGIC